jgi:hypothetical protein
MEPPAGEPHEPDQPPGIDLLGVALLVFFLALIGVVAALLLVPALTG